MLLAAEGSEGEENRFEGLGTVFRSKCLRKNSGSTWNVQYTSDTPETCHYLEMRADIVEPFWRRMAP